ncbi:hypothetical protein T484DRAFT_1973601 [Baffinella frigidus]|nr:hypothetical protein T484DRAFT_1973601 [Cryptophyta sp. CCMP2293]
MLCLRAMVLLLAVPLSSSFTPSLVHHTPRSRLRCTRPSTLAMSSKQAEDQAGSIPDLPDVRRSYISESFSRELLGHERFASEAPEKFAKVVASGSLTRRQRIARLGAVLLDSVRAIKTRVLNTALSRKAVSSKSWRAAAPGTSAAAPVFVPTPRPGPPAKQAATVRLQPQLVASTVSEAVDASDRMESLLKGYAKKHGGAEEASKVVRSEIASTEISTGDDRLDALLGGYSKRHGGGAAPRSRTTTLTAALDASPKSKVQRSKYADFGKSEEETERSATERLTKSRSKQVASVESSGEEGSWSRISRGGTARVGGAGGGRGESNAAVALQEVVSGKPKSRLDQLVMGYSSKYEGSKGASIRTPSPSSQTLSKVEISEEEVSAASAPAEPESFLAAPEASAEKSFRSAEILSSAEEQDEVAGVGGEERGGGVGSSQ